MLKLVFIVFTLFCSLTTSGNEKEIITWARLNNTPWYISEGADKNKGTIDLTIEAIKKQLPQYRHTHQKMNLARWMELGKQGAPVCIGLVYKTDERLKYFEYSVPSNLLLSARVIISRENHKKFGYAKEISFEDLISDKNFVGIFQSARSNGQIDDILNKYKGNKWVIEKPFKTKQMYDIIMAGRADYMIELPFIVNYIKATSYPQSKGHYSIKISEIDTHKNVHVACTKGQWGKVVISDINKTLTRLYSDEDYFNIFNNYLTPEPRKEYKKLYHNRFLNIKKTD